MRSDVSVLWQGKRVLKVHAKVADRAFDRPVPEKKLNGTQIARTFVDPGSLGSAEWVVAGVFVARKPYFSLDDRVVFRLLGTWSILLEVSGWCGC